MLARVLRRPRALSILLLLAFLPTLAFLGHWGDLFEGSGAVDVIMAPVSGPALFDAAAQQAEKATHAQHCHTDLGSCSGQPMPAGVGLFATHEALFLPPSVKLPLVLRDGDNAPRSAVIVPLSPPPRAL